MKDKQASKKLSRYTTLPVLLALLRRKKLSLRDPSHWEDKNDVEVIAEYKNIKNVQSLFAVCFCIGDETVHHWKTYANGDSGCCIEFDQDKLLASFKGKMGFRWGKVRYKKINEVKEEVKNGEISLNRYPFIKRWPYRFEEEFRILWEGETTKKIMDVDIDLNSINKITLSQGMPPDLNPSIKKLLRDEIRDSSTKINRSTLYRNIIWINSFKK
jgi:hypothetical protein